MIYVRRNEGKWHKASYIASTYPRITYIYCNTYNYGEHFRFDERRKNRPKNMCKRCLKLQRPL